MTTREHYLELAAAWQARANEEQGKSLENGWSSWELHAAEARAAHCLDKRDACLAKAATLQPAINPYCLP